ncbi:MAG: hypothetical protein LBS19_10810 [Clostridiales bacterium]|jgi:uncharacterized membrane protein|nr:hypothetical protein [Clostridiales bacterium]
MKQQLMLFVTRLKKPSTLISLISQVVSILLLLGVHVDQNAIMSVAAAGCSVLVTMGVLSNPDTKKKGYGDDLLTCSKEGKLCKHVMVNGQMVCEDCGAVYTPPEGEGALTQAEEPITETDEPMTEAEESTGEEEPANG